MWEILDALGSVAGAVLASVAAFVAFRLYKVESLRDQRAAQLQERRDSEARRQQAACVGIWAKGEHEKDQPPVDTINLANHSALPIYWVELMLGVRDKRGSWSTGIESIIVPPGEVLRRVLDERVPVDPDYLYAVFTDNAGIRWRRDKTGLHELTDES